MPLAGLPGYRGIPLPGYLATFLLFLGFALMAPWGLQRAGRQHAVRELRWHYDDDGCLMIRVTLPPEQGALVIEALQAARDVYTRRGEGTSIWVVPSAEMISTFDTQSFVPSFSTDTNTISSVVAPEPEAEVLLEEADQRKQGKGGKDARHAAHEEALEVQFGGDSQIDVDAQRVVVRDERPGGRPTGDRVEGGPLDLDEPLGRKRAPDRVDDLRPPQEPLQQPFHQP